MKTRNEIISKTRKRVRKTQVYHSLGKIPQQIVNTGHNVTAIHRSLETVRSIGIRQWEEVSQNNSNNKEIVRELYANSLEVKF